MLPGDDDRDAPPATSSCFDRLSPADQLMARAIHAAPSDSLWRPARRVDLDALARLRLMGWQWDTIYRELVVDDARSQGSAALLRSAAPHHAPRRPGGGWWGARALAVAVLVAGVVTVTLSGAFCRFQSPPPQAAVPALGGTAVDRALPSSTAATVQYAVARAEAAGGAVAPAAARRSLKRAAGRSLVAWQSP
jgi:hypothetical protein